MTVRQTARPASTATSRPFNVHNLLHVTNTMANAHALRALGVRTAQRRFVAPWPWVETGLQEAEGSVSVRKAGRA